MDYNYFNPASSRQPLDWTTRRQLEEHILAFSGGDPLVGELVSAVRRLPRAPLSLKALCPVVGRSRSQLTRDWRPRRQQLGFDAQDLLRLFLSAEAVDVVRRESPRRLTWQEVAAQVRVDTRTLRRAITYTMQSEIGRPLLLTRDIEVQRSPWRRLVQTERDRLNR
jgi:transcriptional regulator GlxA family with amidase domain